MKPERFAHLKKLILAAADLPADKRKAFLDQACGDDPDLRQEAEAILAKGAEDSAILRQAGDVPELAHESADETPPLPEKIGQYTIKRVIAAGGMGVVYEALQEKPRRTVALKLMKSGIASSSALHRFEYESQLLARLQHSGIAQVYEAGTHDDGTGPIPYFAMEYVPNARAITEYAEQKKLGTRDRLKLFAQVCDAVHHGHQKGIIHRDLKPGNILVNPDGRVKIIDFGVARSTDSDMALTTQQTDVGELIGTLQYMSPEQCAADPNDIDIRSDVYALGVVQYELLCGRLPYEVIQKALLEVARMIREEPPTRPSTISRQLRGDVETITLKALEKERDRRYQSAVELAQDIRRYLTGEAIIGRPPSMVYQLQIFARRHRAVFGALSAIFVVLAVGLVVSTGMYFKAEQAREETARERDRALTAEQEAEKQRAEAEAVTTFLSDTLAAVDPSEAQGKEVTVREILDKAAEEIDESFAGQPLVEAALRTTIGNTYRALGEFHLAEQQLDEALEIRTQESGEANLETLSSMNNLAELSFMQARYEKAESLQAEVLQLRRQILGEDHPDTLTSLSNTALIKFEKGQCKEADKLHEVVIAKRRRILGEEHPQTLEAMIILADSYKGQGRYDDAIALASQAYETILSVKGEEHPDTIDAMDSLRSIYFSSGRYDDSEQLTRRMIQISQRIYGERHPFTVGTVNNLGVMYVLQKRFDEGRRLIEQAYEISRDELGEGHVKTLLFQNNLGWLSEWEGQYDEAEKIYRAVLELRIKYFGEESLSTLRSQSNLAGSLVNWGRYQEAEAILTEVIPKWRANTSDIRAIGDTMLKYGTCLIVTERYAEAETVLLEAEEILQGVQKKGGRKTQAVYLLATLYMLWGKTDEAELWRARLPDQAPKTELDDKPEDR